jgi:RNA polymerase sigma-70 factor (ECF subfamily)
MDEGFLTTQFDQHRDRLRAVAFRLLGSTGDADDVVQETWLRLRRTDAAGIENLGAWLTTVTARVSLNVLRSRRTRREEPLDPYVPDPLVQRADAVVPEHEAELADSVGLALLVVLETLAPAERLAFVLHDMFAVPFDEIADMVDRSPEAARQLASRARRRVQGAALPDADVVRQREVVDAFFAAARGGDFQALVAILDPDIVLRSDGGPGLPVASAVVRGAEAVANRAITFSQPGATLHPALVNGAAGVVITVHGTPISVMGFTVAAGKVIAIDVLADPARIGGLDLAEVLR